MTSWPPHDLGHLDDWIALIHPRSARLIEAVRSASALVDGAHPADLVRIDHEVRRVGQWQAGSWRSWQATQFPGLIEAVGDRHAVASIMSMHRNGWMREDAVWMLAAEHGGAEVRWLLLRCTDWVPQVREVAQEAVRVRLVDPSGPYVGQLVANLPLILRGVFRGLPLFAALRAELGRDSNLPVLRAEGRSPDPISRRAAVRVLEGLMSPLDLLTDQIGGGDILTVARAARRALASDDAVAAAHLLLDGPFASLRAESLWALLVADPTNRVLLERGLGDRSASVRDVAQRRAGAAGIDPLVWYRDRLASEPVVALRGLGDIGGEEDADTAVAFLDAKQVSTVTAATRVIAAKGGRRHIPELVRVVLNGRGRAGRHAVRGLRRHGINAALAEELMAGALAVGAARPDVVQRVLVGLGPRADHWVALRLALTACGSGEPPVAEQGMRLLGVVRSVWNNSATGPADQLPDIREIWRAVAAQVREGDRPIAEWVDFLLRSSA